MLEEQLKKIWKNASEETQINFNLSRLMIDLKTKTDRIERNIKARDRREIIASYIGVIIFGYFAYAIPFPITKLASILGVCIFIFIIYKLKSAQKEQMVVDMAASFKEQLQQEKTFLIKQRNLLKSVLWWYILPPFFMNILFVLGLGDPATYNWTPELIELVPWTERDKITTLACAAILYGYVYFINRKAARTVYTPVIEDIEKIEQQLAH